MPLPSLRGHEKAHAPSSHAPESLLPSNTPLEFLIILSACRIFLGTEEPAKLEALLQQGPERDMGTLHLHISLDGRTNLKAQEAE
jgi:hypothetical protein